MNDSKRAYNTYEENQRIKAAARVAKKEGTVGPIPTTVNLNNSKRTYLTYEEEQRIKESVKVYNKELERDEEAEIEMWYVILCLPDFLRDILSESKLRFLTPIYNVIVLFLFYKFTLYLESVFNFKGNVYDTLFNNPYKPSSAEIQGSIFYLIIFGLPILYTIIQVIRFGIFTIKDIFRLFKRKQYPKQTTSVNNIEDNNLKEEQEEIIINNFKDKEEPKEDIDLFKVSEDEVYNSKNEYKNYDTIKSVENNIDYDPYLYEVIESILELEEVTTLFIQKRFKVGYARATRILEQMEERGIISKYEGSKPREVLITKEEWEKLKCKI